MLIDTHCHLNDDYSPKTTEQIISEARAAGVEVLITIATQLSSFNEVQKISEDFPDVFHSIGVHPHETKEMTEDSLDMIRKYAAHPKCRAIGEIGLDYHYMHSTLEVQQKRLEDQLEIAAELKLPAVIHSRDAEEDLLRILSAYAKKLPPGEIPGVIHCFSGTHQFGLKCIELGFYISFSGIITFKKAEELRESAKIFPLDRLLLETDSPYLAPIPHRGKKCESAMVKFTAEKLAEIRNVSFEEIASKTTSNAKTVFRI